MFFTSGVFFVMISEKEVESYFDSQLGASASTHPVVIRGRGVGGALLSVAKLASPLLLQTVHSLLPASEHIPKSAVQELGTAAMDSDTVSGHPLQASAKPRLAIAKKRVAASAKKPIKAKRKRIVKDFLS